MWPFAAEPVGCQSMSAQCSISCETARETRVFERRQWLEGGVRPCTPGIGCCTTDLIFSNLKTWHTYLISTVDQSHATRNHSTYVPVHASLHTEYNQYAKSSQERMAIRSDVAACMHACFGAGARRTSRSYMCTQKLSSISEN